MGDTSRVDWWGKTARRGGVTIFRHNLRCNGAHDAVATNGPTDPIARGLPGPSGGEP